VLVRQRVLQVVSSTLTVGASVRSWPLLLPRQSRLENQTYIGPRVLRRQSETTTKPSMKATSRFRTVLPTSCRTQKDRQIEGTLPCLSQAASSRRRHLLVLSS